MHSHINARVLRTFSLLVAHLLEEHRPDVPPTGTAAAAALQPLQCMPCYCYESIDDIDR